MNDINILTIFTHNDINILAIFTHSNIEQKHNSCITPHNPLVQ